MRHLLRFLLLLLVLTGPQSYQSFEIVAVLLHSVEQVIQNVAAVSLPIQLSQRCFDMIKILAPTRFFVPTALDNFNEILAEALVSSKRWSKRRLIVTWTLSNTFHNFARFQKCVV